MPIFFTRMVQLIALTTYLIYSDSFRINLNLRQVSFFCTRLAPCTKNMQRWQLVYMDRYDNFVMQKRFELL